MIRTIHLYGPLGERFGRTFTLSVSSLAEACRAIGCQVPGFEHAIREGHFRVKCGKLRGKGLQLAEEQIPFRLPPGDIHIVPVLSGAKRSGIGKILAGVLIAAVAWWAAPAAAAGGMGAAIFGGFTYGNAAMLGLGMVLTGLSQALSPQQKNTTPKAQEQNASFLFNSVQNVTAQGGPVPLIYGRTLVGSVVISTALTTEDAALDPS